MALDLLLTRYGQGPSEVSLLFTSDEEIRRLNGEFRGIDEATDVLSFPAPRSRPFSGVGSTGVPQVSRPSAAKSTSMAGNSQPSGSKRQARDGRAMTLLGDIAISIDFAERQAAHHGHATEDEIVFLVLHGGLHLLGFDDETEADREDMVRRMNEIAGELGMKACPGWSSVHEEGAA